MFSLYVTAKTRQGSHKAALATVLQGGASYLIERVDANAQRTPTPIGFYFANLWYFERLYLLVFGVSALARLQGLAPHYLRKIQPPST